MDIKTIVTGHHSRSILNSCELGEDAATETYAKLITNHPDDLTGEQQMLINIQFARTKSNHDQIKNMRDILVEQ